MQHLIAADRQHRVRTSAQASHANVLCSVDGAPQFAAIFRSKPKEALDIYSGSAPTLSFALVCAPAVGQGSVVVVEGVGRFEVAHPVEPDATGWLTLQLRDAPLADPVGDETHG